ncbi:MAG: hypothetical protein QXL69_00930 [Candidatus Bathyarchaeia archaeon]|nr:hypothetical protein [Candidatus Bathyarchaeota archaeon]
MRRKRSSKRDKLVIDSLLGFLAVWRAIWTPLIIIFKCVPSRFNCDKCKDFEFCDRRYWIKREEE